MATLFELEATGLKSIEIATRKLKGFKFKFDSLKGEVEKAQKERHRQNRSWH